METSPQSPFQRIAQEVGNILDFGKRAILKILHLADDTDYAGTVKAIKSGIVLEGSNLWVLICAAAIASIGLDTNSPAVIIGAMLISPLMSPILGIGLSLGINDKESLIKSLYNFGIATALSLAVSMIYFTITPLGLFTDEMKGRTMPTILDAGIALFGGLAGIIAGSRIEKSNAIPGVAIATALMPPVCTSGFGLATGRIEVFWGAFYLFLINAVLISLATYLMVRFLRFPLVEQESPEFKSRLRSVFVIAMLILLYPSYRFLRSTLADIKQKELIAAFISDNIHKDVEKGADWQFLPINDSTARLQVYYFGKYIAPDSVAKLEQQLTAALHENGFGQYCRMELTPTDAPPDEEKKRIKNRIDILEFDLRSLSQRLSDGEARSDSLIWAMRKIKSDTVPFQNIASELKVLYPELERLSIGKSTYSALDSIAPAKSYTIVLDWNRLAGNQRRRNDERIGEFLKLKLQAEQVEVLSR